MRNLSATALAKLGQKLGNEPILLLEVDWTDTHTASYADRTVGAVPGKILEVGNLDNVVAVSNNNTSQSIDLSLDDTDGSIKAIFNQVDIHKRPVRVYQYFHGLDLSDKFLLFAGKVSSPVTWNERDRSVRFTVISQLEDKEIGFSAEEGQFPLLPANLVGKPWPVIFGLVQDCPALQVNEAVQGTLLTGLGILSGLDEHLGLPLYSNGLNMDSGLGVTLAQLSAQISCLWCAYAGWSMANPERAADIIDQINALYAQRTQAASQSDQSRLCTIATRQEQVAEAEEKGLGENPARVLGGEDFPQRRTITVIIDGGLFTGYFNGEYFHISSREQPEDAEDVAEDAASRNPTCAEGTPNTKYDYRMDVPCGRGNDITSDTNCECRFQGFIISTDLGGTEVADDQIVEQFWAEPGSAVRIYSAEPITYIVSIVPGTVLAVKAYKSFEGYRQLCNVPSDLYEVQVVNYGPVTAVQLVFQKSLSALKDQGWGDDVYVTFESSVGPNIIDIMKYIIERWTDLTWDAASFDSVRTKLMPFPANFPILERKPTLDVLQEIAYQARCALWISNGVFFIKYLPEEPAADGTITVSDVDAERGMEVSLTSTEDIITKMRVQWRISWAPGQTDQDKDKSEKWIILRHNVTRYGIQEEDYFWYIYNQPDIILKCATFWLMRKSCTWKQIKFSTFLNKLNLETFDCVNLDFNGGYVASGAAKALVQQANFDSESNLIDFECLVPVRAGEMEQSKYFWPAALRVDETWPPQADIDSNNAGGGGIGMDATGNLPVGYIDGINSGGVVWVGGPNVVFRAQSDWGDRTPTDVGFQAQQVVRTSSYADLAHTSKPKIRMRVPILKPSKPLQLADLKSGLVLDLETTIVQDSRYDDNRQAKLKSFFHTINSDGKLMLRPDALVGDADHEEGVPLDTAIALTDTDVALRSDVTVHSEGSDPDAEFDFKYDGDGGKWGAGTAFLKD